MAMTDSEIVTLQTRIHRLETQGINWSEVKDFQNRIARLEALALAQSARLGYLEERIKTLTRKVI